MSDKKKHGPLLEELDGLYKEMQKGIAGASFFGKSLAPALEPLERVILFVGKVVKKVEEQDERIAWLEQELTDKDSLKHKE